MFAHLALPLGLQALLALPTLGCRPLQLVEPWSLGWGQGRAWAWAHRHHPRLPAAGAAHCCWPTEGAAAGVAAAVPDCWDPAALVSAWAAVAVMAEHTGLGCLAGLGCRARGCRAGQASRLLAAAMACCRAARRAATAPARSVWAGCKGLAMMARKVTPQGTAKAPAVQAAPHCLAAAASRAALLAAAAGCRP